MVYEAPSTPESLARYLATYITDDAAICAHVKHRFGVRFDGRDIQRFRSSLPKKGGVVRGNIVNREAMGEFAIGKSTVPHIGADPLLKALAAYHMKRCKTAEEYRHWKALT